MRAPYWHPPESVVGTVFDPSDSTFGPIMQAIQSGEFEKAIALLVDMPRAEDAPDMKAIIQPGKTCKWITAIDPGDESKQFRAIKQHNSTFFALRRLRQLQRDVQTVSRNTERVPPYIHRTLRKGEIAR